MDPSITTKHSISHWFLPAVLLLIAGLAAGLPRLQQEPSIEALIRPDNPALELRRQVRETFGLKDPVVVALAMPASGEMMRPDALDALRRVTEAIRAVPQVDPEQVFSLSTQQWVRSEDDALVLVTAVPDDVPAESLPAAAEQALNAMPIFRGTLIAYDGSAALIAAELRDDRDAADAYEAIVDRVESIQLPAGMRFYAAGEATSIGFLSRYMQRDAYILTPVAGALMLVCLLLFLRSWQGMLAGAFVMLGTLVATLGAMAWFDAKIFVITSSMPAILLSISIADIIHYGERVARLNAEGIDAPTAIRQGLRELGRPILLTSLTNAAGFVGMAATTDEIPLIGYGAAAAFGVMVAWVLTVLGVPAIFRLVGLPKAPPVPLMSQRRLEQLGDAIARRPGHVLGAVGLMLALGVWQAGKVQFNEDRIANFGAHSSVFQANRLINERFAGTNYLDVVLEAAPGRSLIELDAVARIDGLQRWMESEGHFSATYSFVDLLQGIAHSARDDGLMPASSDELEQFLFLYEAYGKPGELRQEISVDRTRAYLRGYLRSGEYQANHAVLTALQRELDARFAGSSVRAQPAGAVLLTDSFVGPYLPSTLWSVALSALLVGMMCALLTRSLTDGLLCMVPVAVGVLCVFGLMGALGIWLSIATSMFASISIGLGVDFAIHTLHATRRGQALGHEGPALTRFVISDVGRPLTANALVLALGFSVTILSSIPPLRSFGLLVASTVFASYLSAILILPALFALRTRGRRHAAQTSLHTPEIPS